MPKPVHNHIPCREHEIVLANLYKESADFTQRTVPLIASIADCRTKNKFVLSFSGFPQKIQWIPCESPFCRRSATAGKSDSHREDDRNNRFIFLTSG